MNMGSELQWLIEDGIGRKFKVGVLYEWPEIPYNTPFGKGLRMSLQEDGKWVVKGYTNVPIPFDPCFVLFNAMMSTPCNEVEQ